MEKPGSPLVSVVILTRDQKPYIRKALDSVLAQETRFPFELVIGDDASTDGTRAILLEYAQRRPDCIRLNLSEKPVGPSRLAHDLVLDSRGTYLAFCEGDDYWIAADKLQRQVDFLETHPDYIGCACKSLLIDSAGKKLPHQKLSWVKPKERFTFRDFCGGKYLPGQTASIVKRNIFLNSQTDWSILYTANPYISDRTSTELFLLQGDFHCMKETLCAYRVVSVPNSPNVTSLIYKSNQDWCKNELRMTEALENYATSRLSKPVLFYEKRCAIFFDALLRCIRRVNRERLTTLFEIARKMSPISLLYFPKIAAEKIINHFTCA